MIQSNEDNNNTFLPICNRYGNILNNIKKYYCLKDKINKISSFPNYEEKYMI